MVVAALCHLCGRPSLANCFQCGRPTCVLHFDRAHHRCASCRAGRRAPGAIRT